MLTLFTPVAWLVPERFWFPICLLVAKGTGRLMPSRRRRSSVRRMPAYLQALMTQTEEQTMEKVVAGWHRDMVQILRCNRPDGWKPEIDLRGVEHLEAALKDGHGAILWVADFESASLIEKMALGEAGYQVSHLSRPQHGYSASAFGIRFLNPIRTRVENRYIKERITMRAGGTSGSLRTLRKRLEENGIISITVLHFNFKGQAARTDFFDGQIDLPTGPMTLARATKAHLLPVFTLRKSASSFEVTIEPPLAVSSERDNSKAFSQYAHLLSVYVRQDPVAWRGWQYES